MTCLVFADDEESEWRVEQAELSSHLLDDWPSAEIQESTPSDSGIEGRGLRWTCDIEGDEVEAWLNKAGTCLYIDGPLHGVVVLVAWFRSRMSQQVEFSMCDDSYSFQVVIEVGMSALDILESIPD
ncbi:hypothetical protein [Streptomyces sp. NBC_01465]|uniref:hypothetical protein n=1 Tax=Streptomyces sp. NBC_01465 TaxID=2903878 RepID=UPI002E34EEAD|nr:hypothetical protein [Streptomyces sp. NBC_01465]